MRIIKLFAVILGFMSLSGCYDANEPNDYAYAVAIGVDKAENEGELEISIQFAKPAQISGGGSEEGGKGGETLGLVTVEAPSIYSGINLANSLVSKRFQLSHTKIIVISEELAKEGIKDIVYTIVRSTDLRPNMYIAVAKGKAKDYLAAVKPEMEINPVKYYQLIFENKYAEFVPRTVSQHIYFYMDSLEKEIVLPVVSKSAKPEDEKSQGGSEENSGSSGGSKESGGDSGDTKDENTKLPETNAKTNYQGYEYLVKEYIAGNVDASKKNKSEAIGMAVFSKDKMVGEMSSIECELYNIINGTYQYNYNTFFSEKFPEEPIVMLQQMNKKPKISVEIRDRKPVISVNIELEGSIVSSNDEYLVEEDIYEFEKEMGYYTKQAVEKFLERTAREFEADIIGFGVYAKKNFADLGEFEDYNWKEKYKDAEFKVEAEYDIKRAGLIIKSSKREEKSE